MPTYEIYKKDGTPIRVEGPEGASTEELIDLYIKQRLAPERKAPEADGLERMLELSREAQRKKPVTVGQAVVDLPKSFLRGATGIAESGLLGTITPLPEFLESPARKGIQALGGGIQDLLAPPPNIQAKLQDDEFQRGELLSKFGEALGSFGGILGTAAINPLAGAGLAVTAGAGEASERARAAGAKESERAKAARLGAVVGASELISPLRIIGKFKKNIGNNATDDILTRGRRIRNEAGAEGVQEFSASVAQNLIEKGIYNPEQGFFTGSGEALGYGAGVGGFVQAITEMIMSRRGRKNVPEVDDEGDADRTRADLPDEQKRVERDTRPLQLEKDTPPRVGLIESDVGRDDVGKGKRDPSLKNLVDFYGTLEGPALEARAVEDLDSLYSDVRVQQGITDKNIETATGKETDKETVTDLTAQPRYKRGFQPKDTREANEKAKSVYEGNLQSRYYLEEGQKPDQLRTFNENLDIKPKPAIKELSDGTTLIIDDPTKPSVLDVDDLPVQDKNKVLALIESKPPRERGEGDPKEGLDADYPNVDFLVAQTLSKDPNVENVLDEAAYQMRFPEREAEQELPEDPTPSQKLKAIEKAKTKEVKKFTETVAVPLIDTEKGYKTYLQDLRSREAKGETIEKKDKSFDAYLNTLEDRQAKGEKIFKIEKQIDPGGPYYRGMKKKITPEGEDAYFLNNTGQEAALRVANWVENNFSPEGKAWFNERVELYSQDKPIGTKGQQGRVRRFQKREERSLKKDKKEETAFKKELVNPTTGERYDAEIVADVGFYSSKAGRVVPITEKQRKAAQKSLDNLDALPYSEIKKYDRYEPSDVAKFDPIGRELKKEQAWNRSVKEAKKMLMSQYTFGSGFHTEGDLNELAKELYYFKYKSEYLGLKTKEERKAETDKLREEKRKFGAEALRRRKEKRFVKEQAAKKKTSLTSEEAMAVAMDFARKNNMLIRKEVELREDVDKEFKLPKDAVIDLEYPLSTIAIDHLGNNRLSEALKVLALDTSNKVASNIANMFADLTGTTEVVIVKNLKVNGRAVAGSFNPKTNTIQLDAESGMTRHVLLHEMAHALASAELAKKSSPFAKQISNIFEQVKDKLGTAYGASNVDEFVSELMSNHRFQQVLSRINIKGDQVATHPFVVAMQRLKNIFSNLWRRLTGQPQVDINAFSLSSDIVESLLAPAPKYRDAGMFFIGPSNIKDGFKNFLNRPQKRKKFLNKEEQDTYTDMAIETLARGTVTEFAKDSFLGIGDLQTISTLADKIGFKGTGDRLNVAIQKLRGALERAGREFDTELQKINSFMTDPAKQKKKELLDKVIYSLEYGATIYQIDPDKKESDYINKKGEDIVVDGNNLREKWRQNQRVWKELGPEGRNVYRTMRNFYRKQYKKLLNSLETEMDRSMSSERAKKLKEGPLRKLFAPNTLDVYFPLIREGDYVVTYELKDPKKNGDPRVTVLTKTQTAADNLARKLDANDDVVADSVRVYSQKEANNEFVKTPPTGFVGEILAAIDAGDLEAEQKRATKDEIIKLYINTLPETSFARSLQGRRNIVGFDADSLAAFKDKGFSLARQVAQLEQGREIRKVESDIQSIIGASKNEKEFKKQSRLRDLGIGPPTIERVGTELLRRGNFARNGAYNKGLEKIAKTANQTAFLYTIGANISSALVNLSQVPLFVYPYFGAEYGYDTTFGAIKDATKIVGNGKVDITSYYDIKDGEYTVKDTMTTYTGKTRKVQDGEKKKMEAFAPLIKEADERGQLTRTWILDALGIGETGREKRGDYSLVDKITGLSAGLFNYAERANRQTTLLASYELALRKIVDPKGKMFKEGEYSLNKLFKNATQQQIDEAVNTALKKTQETNGGTVLETAPRIAQQHLGRVAMMYKSYGIRMYTTMLQSTYTMFNGFGYENFSKEERKIAMKQLIGVHLSALFFAGIQGLPLYGALTMLADIFLLDDEDDDADTVVRKTVGEEWYKGAVNLITGMDVASRTRLTGLLIQENRYNKDASFEENVFFYLGGPAFSTGDRLARALGDFKDGNFERGVEGALPTALSNAWKASFGRVAREGYQTRRGDAIYGDPTFGDLAGLFMGIPPVEYTQQMEKNNILKNIDVAINKKKTKIVKKLYTSMRQGDFDAYEDALEELQKHNEKHPLSAITPESIRRSMNRHKESSKNIARNNGINISSANQDLINLNEAEYDSDYTFFG